MTTPTIDEPHPSLLHQVNARRAELEGALSRIPKDDASARARVEQALASLIPMLTGDLEHMPDMVSRDLVRWLDVNKYVAGGGMSARPAVSADAKPDAADREPDAADAKPDAADAKPDAADAEPDAAPPAPC